MKFEEMIKEMRESQTAIMKSSTMNSVRAITKSYGMIATHGAGTGSNPVTFHS